jgi:hypothetical protein
VKLCTNIKTQSLCKIPLISIYIISAGFASMSKDVLTGLNITKGGSDPPLKSDEEYPEWLWKLAQPERTLADLKRKENSSLEFEEVSELFFFKCFCRCWR